MKSESTLRRGMVLVLFAVLSGSLAAQQTPRRGTISGTLTADRGSVRGFRVNAHNLQYRIWYSVYTKAGRYQIPQALPGPYEISVWVDGYKSSIQKAELAGQTLTADLAVSKQLAPSDVTYLEFDQLYPPGPDRDLVEKN